MSSGSRRFLSPLLQIKQELFAPQPAAVAAEFADLVDDAVARDEDGNAVQAVGPAHGALGGGGAGAAGQLFVGTGLAVGNAAQLGPDALLKRTAGEKKRYAEFFQLAGEVARQLFFQEAQVFVLTGNDGAAEALPQGIELGLEHPPLGEFEQAHAFGGSAGDQPPKGAFNPVKKDAVGIRAFP